MDLLHSARTESRSLTLREGTETRLSYDAGTMLLLLQLNVLASHCSRCTTTVCRSMRRVIFVLYLSPLKTSVQCHQIVTFRTFSAIQA